MSDDREVLEVDVLVVGGGPAGLACAKRLGDLLPADSEAMVVLLEKAKEIGFHAISGAVMDPRGIRELIPDFLDRGCPVEAEVAGDELWLLLGKRRIRAPILPPPLRNHGAYVCSLGKVVRWLAGIVEADGRVQTFPEFPGARLLVEEGRVVGVRTGDKGVGKDGRRKANYEPGIDVRAKLTILAEGARGSLAKTLFAEFGRGGGDPQVYAIGIKELWKMPPGRVSPGRVIHTLGHPMDLKVFGGGFAYGMRDDVWDVGFVTGLDYEDPRTDPHGLFAQWKSHPAVAELLSGGEMIQYGAKAIPEGGWYARPRPAVPGCLVIGDAAGLLNAARLKGIHLSMKSGMLAAETAAAALAAGDFSAEFLGRYEEAVSASWIAEELIPARNFRQGFENGLLPGLANAAISTFTGGRGLRDRLPVHAGHTRMKMLADLPAAAPSVAKRAEPDGKLVFDRLTDVYRSGTKHEEDQPVHLVVRDLDVCRNRCTVEYGNPCTKFCPAAVYEMEEDPERGGLRLRINAGNCVHCKTCDVMDPYQIIDWTTPEGGDGPRYANL